MATVTTTRVKPRRTGSIILSPISGSSVFTIKGDITSPVTDKHDHSPRPLLTKFIQSYQELERYKSVVLCIFRLGDRLTSIQEWSTYISRWATSLYRSCDGCVAI